jgi:hypothetical protein
VAPAALFILSAGVISVSVASGICAIEQIAHRRGTTHKIIKIDERDHTKLSAFGICSCANGNRKFPINLIDSQLSDSQWNQNALKFADTLYFDPCDGHFLGIWKYGVNRSFGDWLIWLQIPLHFGAFRGLGIKLLWAGMALSIPLLCVTGALMYWNRVLRKLRPLPRRRETQSALQL